MAVIGDVPVVCAPEDRSVAIFLPRASASPSRGEQIRTTREARRTVVRLLVAFALLQSTWLVVETPAVGAPGTQYRFRVQAINAAGTGAYSTVTNAVVPSP